MTNKICMFFLFDLILIFFVVILLLTKSFLKFTIYERNIVTTHFCMCLLFSNFHCSVSFFFCQSGQFSEDMIPTVGFNMRKITKGNVTIKGNGQIGFH